VDLDLRKVRYFVVLAEELNYRRAAERLHVAQPVLTRQIRSLERDLTAQLFERGRAGTRLTDAGRQLLTDAQGLLADAQATRRRVARLGRTIRTFTIGFMPGLTVTEPARAFAASHPELTVDVLRTDWTDQVPVLHDGRVDIGYVRMPIDLTALSSWLLFTEPQVAVVPVAHQLAGRDRVSVHELVGERLLQHPNAVPEWAALHSTPPVVARQARSVEEKLEWVAAGEGFSVVPQSVAMYYQRADITWMVLTDVAPNEVRLAWPTAQHGRLIEDYLEAARSTVTD
jgi:DNA-binding transcriptional LysR family regulator